MDWKKNIGKIISFTTSDRYGNVKDKGVLYSVTEDIWRPKRTPETTLHFWNESHGLAIRVIDINKFTIGKKYKEDVTSREWLDNPK